ncbi:MAG: metallopeptidase TldD-related protein [Phycisphaerae bacterium]
MNDGLIRCCSLATCLILVWPTGLLSAGDALSDNDVIMRAIVDEMTRSMDELYLEGLSKPYMITLGAEDAISYNMQASYGAILRSVRRHSRSLKSRVRVGDYNLDNTNLGFATGGRSLLPLDDNYTALRQAVWSTLDQDYKRAVETLARKKAYLQQKNVVDRPADYAPGQGVVAIEPSPEIVVDRSGWEETLRRISIRFEQHPAIQDSSVSFTAVAANRWIASSEGTRIRTGDTGALLRFWGQLQAEEGMRLSDAVSYIALQPGDLPPVDQMLADVDAMCEKLDRASKAAVLDEYTGPILFDAPAAGRVFEALLIDGLCARPIPLGSGGRGDESLEKKIGRRILPRTFRVFDDPTQTMFDGTVLVGSYQFDDEGTPAQRVDLVERGILKSMIAARAPTKKTTKTNGHGRSAGFGDPQATIGCLYISDDKGFADAELQQALIQAAKDEGLTYGLRIESMEAGRGGSLGNPIYGYKVFVDDGHEEMIRGMEFGSIETRELKHILAGGRTPAVYNRNAGAGYSIIAPAILFEELELTKIEKEFDRLPILNAPETRKP